MSSDQNWTPAGPDLASVFAQYPDPLLALSEARIPAILLRRVYDPAQCHALIQRFIERGLMPAGDPREQQATRGTTGSGGVEPWANRSVTRIDIGSSLGNRGSDKEAFLQHAAGTHELFRTLFEGFEDPVKRIYD